MKKYHLLYTVEGKPDGVTKAEIPPNTGACDAILMASIAYPPDGSISTLFIGHDGRTNDELDENEWWKVWSFLAARLAKSTTLSANKKEVCALVWDIVCQGIAAARAEQDAKEADRG